MGLFYWVGSPTGWIALLSLSALEIVLGIDNVVFLSILVSKLPADQHPKAMRVGMILAVIPRVLLLLAIGWVISLNTPLITLPIVEPDTELFANGQKLLGITGQDLVFIVGGIFLIYKSVKEIHHKLEGKEDDSPKSAAKSFVQIIPTILIINIVFSLDSVITAVGMVDGSKVGGNNSAVVIMILGVLVSTAVMVLFASAIAKFVDKHPTIKMLALSFLILIGVNLIAEGLHQHIPKGYTYFAMTFAVLVEMLNIRMGRSAPVQLNEPDFQD